jgi:site-specific DNA recombinase
MTRAVCYARFSSDHQRESSITDQVRNCKRIVEREGWAFGRVFKDEAISGATNQRPGYQAMLAAMVAGEFDVLIVDDLSRLSRDEIETKQTIRRLVHRDIRIIGASDGFDTHQRGHKIQASVRAMMGELFLDDLKEKTHRGLTGRALAGQATGARLFGYRSVPILDPKRVDEYGRPVITGARREIDPEQAKIVVHIFSRYSLGDSPRAIADGLNRQGVKGPRGGSWSAYALYGAGGEGMLCNATYIGKCRWNRSSWTRDPDTGKKVRKARPEAEWVQTDQPQLRIVSDELWAKVQARQVAQHAISEEQKAKLHPKARTGRTGKFLFSGLLRCGQCGASYIVSDATHYRCATNITRGDTACANRTRVARTVVEERLLEAIKRDLFTPAALEQFKADCRRKLAEARAARVGGSDAARKELAKVETEIANIAAAIRAGIITVTTKAELEKAEAERARLEKQLKLDALPLANVTDLLPRAADTLKALVRDLDKVVSRDMSKARTAINSLIGPVRLMPTDAGGLDAEVQGRYEGLLSLAANQDLTSQRKCTIGRG